MADDQQSGGSGSSGAGGPVSPPYDAQSKLPPGYQSKITLDRHGEAAERGPKQSDDDLSAAPAAEPHVTITSQGPRIAVTDPIADLRQELGWAQNLKEGGGHSGTTSRRDSDASSIDTDDGEYFDEFDWSEDEQEQQAAKEEDKQIKAIAMRRHRISPFTIVRWLATTFLGNFIVSAALAVPVIVIQFVYKPKGLPTDPDASHREYVADNIQAWFIWAAFNLHVEWWLHFLVEILPRVSMSAARLIWGDVSQATKSRVETYNAVKNYLKLICYAALSWASWAIIFNSIYNLYDRTHPAQSRAPYLERLYEVVEFFFFFTLTIAAEKILIKFISIRFHRTAYADRINKITNALKVFDHLKDNRPKAAEKFPASPFGFRNSAMAAKMPGGRTPGSRTPRYDLAEEGEKVASGQATPKPGFFSTKKHHATHRPASINPDGTTSQPRTPGERLKDTVNPQAAVQAAKMKASHATYLARKAMVDPTHLLTDETVGVGLDVNSPTEARRLARTLFRAYRGRHRRTYLVPSDFYVAYKDQDEAKAAFEVFDTDRNGDISVTEMKQTIVETYKERRFVAKSLEDTSSALSQLDMIFLFVAMIVLAFEAFAIFNVDVSKILTTFYTLAIGASFIFKESAQEVFDSIIFLFVTHPFDTGDRIVVNEAVMVVQKMSLLSCQFLLWDNTQLFINNALLSQMFITNYRRSGYQWECVTMQIAFNTPLEALDAVQADLIHWLQTEPERMFEPSTAIVPQTIDYLRSITVTIGMTHRNNYQDWGARWYRRNCFFAAVCYYMRKHGVKYINSLQPIIYHAPPSYESTQQRQGSDEPVEELAHDRRPSVAPTEAGTVMSDNDDPVLNDNFAPSVSLGDMSAHGHSQQKSLTVPGAQSTTPATGVRAKALMGFTPPQDEIDGVATMRRRKARQNRKDLTIQGGDGGGG